jgi:membrane protein YdbS with pleckstrin-like domain
LGTHDNIHIPKESFPHWIWYVIEIAIVLALSMVASSKITDSIEGLTPETQNYVFIGIVGIFFLVWYIGIRGFILKKKILQNRY